MLEQQEPSVAFMQPLKPARPGLVYEIEKDADSFQIKGLSTLDMSLQPDFSFFFETDYIELAQVLENQIVGKRFCFQEERVYNLSDPGMSWWLVQGQFGFKLFFQNIYFDHPNIMKLGPLGDSQLALKNLETSLPFFQENLQVKSWDLNKKFFSLEVAQAGSLFWALQKLFSEGVLEKSLEELRESLPLTQKYWWKEMATIRAFWLSLESQLFLAQR